MYQISVFLFYQMIKKNLKNENVTTTFKKKNKTFVENYRPASNLSTVSKISE